MIRSALALILLVVVMVVGPVLARVRGFGWRRIVLDLVVTGGVGGIGLALGLFVLAGVVVMNSYGRYYRSECKRILQHLNRVLVRWAARKFSRFHRRKRKASRWLESVSRRSSGLFALWVAGATPRTAGW